MAYVDACHGAWIGVLMATPRVKWHEGVKPEELLTASSGIAILPREPGTLQKGILLHMHDFKWFLAS